QWLIDVSQAAADPATVLGDIIDIKWIPQANRGLLYQRILETKRAAVAKSEGAQQEIAKSELSYWQIRQLSYLVDNKQYAQSTELITALRKDAGPSDLAALVPYEIQCAAKLGTLDALISSYKATPETAPAAENLRSTARQLLDLGDRTS